MNTTSHLNVTFANRSKGRFWSIEEIFQTIAVSFPEWVEVTQMSAPCSRADMVSLFKNISWGRSLKGTNLVHLTGDIHYAILGVQRLPVVLTIHDLRFIEESRGVKRFLFWMLWLYLPTKRADIVTVISESTKRALLRHTGVSLQKVRVVPNCVSARFHAKTKHWNQERPCVLHVGTTPNKNLERLAEACAGLPITLRILGRLSTAQMDLLRASRIDFYQFSDLAQSEVVKLYEQCDIVSFVSTYEGFGMPIVEGQAVGRPVLTSNISPMREVAGGGALLVDPFSAASIREGINRICRDPKLRTSLVEAGFENVKKYSATSVAQQYEQIYRELVPK